MGADSEADGVLRRLRTYELEVVDPHGGGSAFIGVMPMRRGGPGPFGIELRDSAGRARVSILLTDAGPEMLFDQDGNNVIVFGVHDEREANVCPGAFLVVSHLDGKTAYEWHASEGA